MFTFQERLFLLLVDDTKENQLVKNILASPLGLAKDLIDWIFEKTLTHKKNGLDIIKTFAAGIGRAESLSSGYKLAQYYPYMFAMQQFFHSSFRARQGKVLEEMVKEILKIHANCDEVPDKVAKSQVLLSQTFGLSSITHDIDVMGVNNQNNKMILVQLRSRDDTGGTTAKASLVELLRTLLRANQVPKHEVTYLLCIWDERNSQQKNLTIEKIYLSLKDYIEDKDFFEKHISDGYTFVNHESIKLKLAYGTDEISRSIFDWIGKKDKKVLRAIQSLSDTVENWDDLWLAYSVADIELELEIKSISNIDLLNSKWDSLNLSFNFSSYENLILSINDATTKIVSIWSETTIPFSAPSDMFNYIRDLLFLKACYENAKNSKISNQKNNKKTT